MKDINLPPFYVGQKVVALETASNNYGVGVSKGTEYVIKDLFRCKCRVWKVDVGLSDEYQLTSVCTCGNPVLGKIVWCNHTLFAPVETTFEAITFEEVIKIESPLICKQ